MAIIRHTPFDQDLSNRRFSDLLDDFFNEAVTSSNNFIPGLDVSETDDQFLVNVELPGMKKEDIDVSLEDNRLTVSGERSFEKEHDNGTKYHRVESRYGTFERTVQLPDNVDSESVSATYQDGILNISINKSENKVRKQIEIK